MNIGEKILFYRKKLQLSQEQLAEKIGVTRQTISNWELEESSPDLTQAKRLAEIFNVSLDNLATQNINHIESNNMNNNKITIISKLENVIVCCSNVQSSQMYKGGKKSPKYALFSVNATSKIFPNNTFLGWYKNKKEVLKEIEEIYKAIQTNLQNYELKYNVEVDKKFFGMILRIKE